MRKGLIWHITFFIIAYTFCLSTNKASAQLSQNPDKFLGNITTRYQVDAGGGLPAYYTLWNQITPEFESWWGSVEGNRGSYNWGCDTPFNYAKNYGFTYMFNALVWGSQYPNWFTGSLSVEERYKAIVNWFDKVKQHYPELPMIDVVKDAIGIHQQGNPLMKESLGGGGKTGYDWIIKAFELAHERWPNAILIYNDYNTFLYDTDNYIDLVRTLRDAGAPIDAYGCQSHDVNDISKSDLQSSMEKIQNAVKIPMYITELDINIENDAQQKSQYQSIFPVMWEADYCAGVTIWGYVYGSTWVDHSGLYKNGSERPSMTWLKEYMETDNAKNAKSPFPGGKKQISLYIKPASLKATRGDTLDITVRAELVDKNRTIDSVKLYVNNKLVTTMTETPYMAKYVPSSNGKYTLKALVYADSAVYQREGSFTACNPRSTFGTSAIELPGTIQAENFDKGGDGVTYHDSNSNNEGDASSYRTDCEGVDIVNGNGGKAIGYTNTDEWLEYTVNVKKGGYYTYEVVASSGTSGSGLRLSLSDYDGLTDLTNDIAVSQTANNDWGTYKSFAGRTLIPLKEGEQIIRLTITGAGCNIDKVVFSINNEHYQFNVDDITYYSETDSTVSIIRCEKEGNIIIPSTIVYDEQKFKVVEIKSNIFNDPETIKSISIPESVTGIADNAFSGCINVDSIYWNTNVSPSCVTQYCKSSLKYVLLGDYITNIGSNTFSGCSNLTSITIPKNVSYISNDAFSGCLGLTSIIVDPRNTVFDCRNNCNAIIESSTDNLILGCINTIIPVSVTSIGYYAFAKCSGITSITIPQSVTNIADNAFLECSNIDSLYWNTNLSPSCVTQYCNNSLKYVLLGDSVTNIGAYAFYGCDKLTNITIPENVTIIDANAFSSCTELKTISIPENVTNIGNMAFSDCIGLTSIAIPKSVSAISDKSFINCYGLCSVTIPESVEIIGNNAFQNCIGLRSINIPNSVISIGSDAFSGCTGLKSITIPESVTTINNNAFSNCIKLAFLSIPEKTIIANDAFSGCMNIDTINWNSNNSPSCVTQYCQTNLKHVLFGDSITTIGSYAFANCTSITSITIPKNVTTIDNSAFLNCTSLSSITIPSRVISIGSNAFSGCKELTSITIPDNVTTIGKRAFADCNKIVYVSISNNVLDIDYEAFYGCTGIEKLLWNNQLSPMLATQYCSNNLKTIELGEDFQSLDEHALQDCNLNTLVIGSGVKTINEQHFKTMPIKTIWLTNTPPDGYSNVEGVINYVANNNYDLLQNKIVYPFLSSMFNVDGVRYVPVRPSERTCDAIDCLYDKCYTNVVIDSTVSYKNVSMTVHKLNPYAFYRNDNITNAALKINECLGASVFEGCTNLLGILLDGAVNYIDSAAFKGCTSLKTIKIPDSTETIGVSAFQNCTKLSQIDLGVKLKSIGSYAFANCSSLNSIVIPQSVANISDYVFVGCTGIKTIVIDEVEDSLSDVELILGSNGSSAMFADCPLDSVFIGRNIVYPTNRDKGFSPFYSNSTLRTVVITNRETEISENEFYGCSNLKNVSIGNGVTAIGAWAFSGCFSLESFAFGTNVKSIGDEAFSDCNKMTKIISYASIPPICGSQALDDINKWNCTLYIPEGSLADYQVADQWREFFFIEDNLKNGIPSIYSKKKDSIYTIFDLKGNKLNMPNAGINIIRYDDGSTRKVMIR